MSPVPADELRIPLSPVHEPNLLAGGTALPPPLVLPDMLKGEGDEAQDAKPRTVSRAGMTPDLMDAPDSLASPVDFRANMVTPVQAAAEESVSGESAAPSPREDEQKSPPTEAIEGPPSANPGNSPAELICEPSDEDEDAVMALLSLQALSAGRRAATSWAPPSAGEKRPRAGESPGALGRSRPSPMPKPGADGEARYFCKYPHCGKGYASTDAVRKHCRQRHLEWLRKLGHGCPALYCRWGGDTAEEQ
jgi:hypothetical protein